MSYKTEQENFWAKEFGDEYINRNTLTESLPSRLHLFSTILAKTFQVNEIFELGANIGNNLHALHTLLPRAKLKAIEINEAAVGELRKLPWMAEVYHGSLLDRTFVDIADLSFTSGVLIHISPESLAQAYNALYQSSRRYIMVCEYYNPTPLAVAYRGYEGKLFKRDFAGELLDLYSNLRLIDYGFFYRRDPNFPLDDLTWFLIEKS